MFIEIKGVKLYYEIHGTKGTPVIFLHGNGESSGIFKNMPALMQDNYIIYLVDSRGHGRSGRTKQISYALMADDMEEFIEKLGIESPVFIGFSDGGITGLLLAARRPRLLSKLIAAGANTHPSGMKRRWRWLIAASYFFTRNPKDKMMLCEPDISLSELEKIQIPVLILSGGRDIISERHTRQMAGGIKNASLKILPGETHSSYVMDNRKFWEAFCGFLCG